MANDDKWWDSLALNCSYQYWTLSPLGNDTDPDGDSLTLTSIGAYTAEAGYSGLGSVQQVGNQVRYYVPTGFKGTDYGYYYYWISDGRGGTAAATDRVEIYCP